MDYQGNTLRDFLKSNGHVVLQRVNNNYNLRSFTEKEIEHITNGYSTLLGKGAFSEVYRGVLDDQLLVAVKKYKDGTRKEDLAKEVIVHSQINHKNVVRLLGCCTEENALAIVMEFICNGNLADILHRGNANGHVFFPLDRRLSIVIELAEVLSYMHSMYSPILHGDIKPDNILLNEFFAPKISDFGIARLISSDGTQQTQNIIGSIGYLDPLYSQTGILTPKSDVYSFGVLLVEMITRKKAADGNTYLIQNFIEAFKRGKKVRQMFDKEIVHGKKSIKVLDDIAKLANQCLILENRQRPEMVEVADRLRKCMKDVQLRRREEMPESSGSNYPTNPTKKEQPTQVLAISLDELKKITRNFSYDTLIGQGSHAEVFLGELKDSRKCAVKKLDYPEVEELENEFLLKVQSISRLEHNNVVQLLSYCIEGNVRALVYEYSSRGSLHDILHGKKGAVGAQPGQALSWAQRVNIALSSAEGLEFIIEKAEHCITHRIIKSRNILLFDNDVAKVIGDFGVFKSNPADKIDPDNTYDFPHRPDFGGYGAPEYVTKIPYSLRIAFT
ncbi:hypothetical protein PAHAL_5G391600 [Panicum hallii]|uniref:Protein kinase domain-containing protein n=1 Tax=Panicum hallii TaxID=206008 RepID=A0A2S3HWD6_9POAL|nr:hypothetical protein PAHAL_5G391600 [Panicum hallii]